MNNMIKNKINRFLVVSVCLLFASCGGGGGGGANIPSNPNPPPTTPPTSGVSTTTPTVGSTFTLTVVVPSATNLATAGIKIQYNNLAIDLDPAGSVTSSNVANGTIFDTLFTKHPLSSELLLAFYNSNGATYSSTTSRTLVTLTFIAKAQGTTTINFVDDDYTAYCYLGTGCVNQTLPDIVISVQP